MKHKQPITLFLLYCLCSISMALSASEIDYRKHRIDRFNLSTGLLSNNILHIEEDKCGFIWIATEEGVNKYEGSQITSFTAGNDNLSLSNNYAQFMKSNSMNGDIWIATSNGLNIYNYHADSINIVKPSTINQLSSNDIICFAETNLGIWIATYDKGVNFYNFSNATISPIKLPEALDNIFITYIYIDKQNNLWIGSLSDGLFCYSLTDESMRCFDTPRVQQILQDSYGTVWIAASNIYAYNIQNKQILNVPIKSTTHPMQATRIEEDHAGHLWIGCVNKLGYINLKEFHFQQKASFTELHQQGIQNNTPFKSINCIKQDKNNNIWIGTYGDGVFMIHPKKDIFSLENKTSEDKKHLSGKSINAIAYDGNGKFFMATEGSGIEVLNNKFEKINNYTLNKSNVKGINSNSISTLYYDSSGNLWCGANGVVILKKESESFENHLADEKNINNTILSNTIYAFAESRDNSIWICSDIGVTRYKNGRFSNEFYSRAKQRMDVRSIVAIEDNLWLGTYGDGLVSYHIPSGEITKYANNKEFAHNYIRTLKNKGDTLCISTRGAGIQLFSIKQNRFIGYYNKKNGLKSNYIQAIEFDEFANIWTASNQGVSCITPHNIRHYEKRADEENSDFTSGYNYVDEAGSNVILFNRKEGISYINTNSLSIDTHSTNLIFNSLVVNNQEIRPFDPTILNNPLSTNIVFAKKIRLTTRQDNFSIGFVNTPYGRLLHSEYLYLLEGYNTEWINIGEQQEIQFENIPTGKYKLLVKESNNPNQVAELEIWIHSSVWRNSLKALGIITILLLLLYYLWIRYRNKKRRSREIELEIHKTQVEKELWEAKQNMYSLVSRELRTPLSMIIGPIEALKLKYPQLGKELSIIDKSAKSLHNKINLLLDLRKTEMKSMKLKVKQSNLTKQLSKKSIQLNSIPESITGWYDPDLIDKVIHYIICCATELIPNEKLNSIQLFDTEKNGYRWVVIKINHLKCVFEDAEKGGVELHLMKKLIKLHRGNYQINNTIINETEIIIEFPIDENFYSNEEKSSHYAIDHIECERHVEEGDLYDAAEKEHIMLKTNKEHINILLIDIDEVAEYIRHILPDTHHIIHVTDYKKALYALSQQSIDLVICDIETPGISGLTLCEKIKKNIETVHIPVILLSEYHSIELKIEGLKAGADSFITKPFHPQHLQIRVDKLTRSRRLMKKQMEISVNTEVENTENINLNDQILEKTIFYINKNLHDSKLSGDLIAKSLNISRMTLYRKLKSLTGQTTSELIRSLRLKEAALQIENSSKNISDICYNVGFNSPSYFSGCFVDQYGMTPIEYMKAKRAKPVKSQTE